MAEKKVATEVAEIEFNKFVSMMALDVDPKGMDDEDRKSFVQAKRRIVEAIEDGRVVINDKGEPVFTPVGNGTANEDLSPITFREPKGDALMAMDMKRDGHNVAKTYASMSAQTGQEMARFAKMAARDLRICMALYVLFFG